MKVHLAGGFYKTHPWVATTLCGIAMHEHPLFTSAMESATCKKCVRNYKLRTIPHAKRKGV